MIDCRLWVEGPRRGSGSNLCTPENTWYESKRINLAIISYAYFPGHSRRTLQLWDFDFIKRGHVLTSPTAKISGSRLKKIRLQQRNHPDDTMIQKWCESQRFWPTHMFLRVAGPVPKWGRPFFDSTQQFTVRVGRFQNWKPGLWGTLPWPYQTTSEPGMLSLSTVTSSMPLVAWWLWHQ